jgi:transcriptional regulator GlxA family with amidase domain
MPSDPTRDPHVNTLGELRVIGARGVVRGHVVTTVGPLRTRLAEPWTLSSLAGEVHLPRSQLVRSFDATVGDEPDGVSAANASRTDDPMTLEYSIA